MPAPYDYTVNIPQPPAQNFLQSLLGIQQLKGLQQQQELSQQQAGIQQQQAQFAQQMQPLQLQQLQAQIDASKASAAGQSVITAANQLTLDQRKQVADAFETYKKDPEKNYEALVNVAHLMDPTAKQGVAQAVPYYVNKQMDKAFDKADKTGIPVTVEEIQGFSKALTILPTEQQAQAKNAILSMPKPLLDFTKSGVLGITNAAMNDNRQAAVNASDEAAKALYNSGHPAAQATAKLFDQLTNSLVDEKSDLKKMAVSALNVATITGDKQFESSVLNNIKEGQLIQKAELERPLPSSIQKINKDLEDKAKAFDANAAQASNVLEKLTSVPGWDTYYPGKKKITEIQNFFSPQQELVLKNEEERLNKMEGLSEEARKQGRGIGSVRMMQLATSLLPDPWTNPKAAAEKLKLQIETSNRLSKIYNAEVEWNATFVGKNATKDTEIAGVEVKKGQPKSSFISAYKDYMFPEDEVIYAPALDALKSEQNPAARKKSAHDQSLENAARRGAAGAGLGQRVPGTNATFELLPE